MEGGVAVKEGIYKNLDRFLEDSTDNNGYWFPLAVLKIDVPTAVYDIGKIYARRPDLLEILMRKCGIEMVTEVDMEIGPEGVFQGENIFELLKDQREYEVHDFRFWRPRRRESYYTFPCHAEAYYYDESKSWLMYVSHEGTLTFAGDAIAAAAKEVIPDEYLFQGWGIRKRG